MMADKDALVLIFSRNAFYRRLHFLALGAFGAILLAIGCLIWTWIYLLQNPSRPLYFATDEVSRLIEIIPVNTPNMSLDEVSAWTVEAVQSAFSYDYVNYRRQLQDAQKYFTNYGWRNYMIALSLSNNLRALTVRRQIVIAQVIGKPKLVLEGLLSGAYAWKFEMPILVTYSAPPYDGTKQYNNALTISVIVQRQDILRGYKGLGILQIIAQTATSA